MKLGSWEDGKKRQGEKGSYEVGKMGKRDKERKEVLKLRSWEDGKKGEKCQMTNYKCQIKSKF
ncbi:hypothetical protein GQ543_09275 [candidate division WOR-3 bacterium]|nr:hypothetical protein [candidate division WOR-3 bacterium]